MNKHQLVFASLSFVTWCWVSSMPASTANAADAPPNIILVLADDMGWTGLGCYGSTFYETPHIDQLESDALQLFDTSSDIGESNDRSREESALAVSLNAAAMRWLDDLDAPRMKPNPEYESQ